jgi:hypothetical protein
MVGVYGLGEFSLVAPLPSETADTPEGLGRKADDLAAEGILVALNSRLHLHQTNLGFGV